MPPPAPESGEITFTTTEAGRLDKLLFTACQQQGLAHSRELLKKWIEEGRVKVAGQPQTRPAHKLTPAVAVSLLPPPPPPSAFATPRPCPFTVVFEDTHLLVINKPAGVVVHPGAGVTDPTLVEGLLAADHTLSTVGAPLRPGIVHRLDKDTSGLMVVARTEAAHHALTKAFKDRLVTKVYHALAIGAPSPPTGEILAPIGRHATHRTRMAVVAQGREARSAYRVLQSGHFTSLVAVTLFSGRTHQIRVHLAHLGHPLLGDTTYGASANAQLKKHPQAPAPLKTATQKRVWLRSVKLGFDHPVTTEPLLFQLGDEERFSEMVF